MIKFFIDHSTLKYLVKNLVLEGRICRWLLLFQEFTFEVIIKLGRLNVGLNNLSRLESRESGGSLDDQISDVDIFSTKEIPNYLEEITAFIDAGKCIERNTVIQKRYMVVRATKYQLMSRHLYKMGLDQVLWRCLLKHK